MTRIDRFRFTVVGALLLAVCVAVGLLPGCLDQPAAVQLPEPDGFGETSQIIRREGRGPIIMTFTSSPMRKGTPIDGVRSAVLRTLGNFPCSVATFYWPERERIRVWLHDQMRERRERNLPVRIILAGHGLGATEACEVAKDVMARDRDAEIVLLVTVDAVKTNRIGGAAGATGNVLTKRIPGVEYSFTAYDAAPAPDRKRLISHVNYFQVNSTYYHGASMPFAENHRLDDWTGLLNHGNAADFAYAFLLSDLRQAYKEALR